MKIIGRGDPSGWAETPETRELNLGEEGHGTGDLNNARETPRPERESEPRRGPRVQGPGMGRGPPHGRWTPETLTHPQREDSSARVLTRWVTARWRRRAESPKGEPGANAGGGSQPLTPGGKSSTVTALQPSGQMPEGIVPAGRSAREGPRLFSSTERCGVCGVTSVLD